MLSKLATTFRPRTEKTKTLKGFDAIVERLNNINNYKKTNRGGTMKNELIRTLIQSF
jgi:hypothetical protein